LILQRVSEQLGIGLAPRTLHLGGGSRVDVNGVAEDESVFVEVFARHGRLKGAQFHRVDRDALKLITLARDRPEPRLIIAFADREAAACVTGETWLAEARSGRGMSRCLSSMSTMMSATDFERRRPVR
jgi:hypothetical protein